MPLHIRTMLNHATLNGEVPQENLKQEVEIPQISLTQVAPAIKFEKPTVIDTDTVRFVITDSPNDSTISKHLEMLTKYHVKHVCRANLPCYNTKPLAKAGISVHELAFKDGDPPSEEVLSRWLCIVESCFFGTSRFKNASVGHIKRLEDDERISVHCVAGLGRGPLLVAIALVEFCHMEPLEAVAFIRERRRGAINAKQLKWFEKYQRHKIEGCKCSIM